MSRRGENIHKRKDGRWEARYEKRSNRKGDNYLWIFVRKELPGSEGKKTSGITEADANAKKQELFCISDTGVKQSVVGV